MTNEGRKALIERCAKNIAWTRENLDSFPGDREEMLAELQVNEIALAALTTEPGCQKCGGNGSVEIDRGELGVEHMACPKCTSAPPAVNLAELVPDGWKLVPVEMTDEIGEAIAMEARCCGGIALDIYDAALRAAPEPPSC